ncbi:MAG TPA: hypothetical protein VF006_23980 [Longimicrobium sp.]
MPLPRLILLGILLCAPAALDAQAATDSTGASASVRRVEASEHGRRFRRMVLPAAVGSGVGMVAGAVFGSGPFYSATGCCGGGDDPGLTSGLAGALLGATMGATLGAYVTRNSENPVSFSRAFTGATVGIAIGVLVGIAGAELDGADPRGLVIGFSIGQGMTTAGFAVPYP